jgi:hypothetical protein
MSYATGTEVPVAKSRAEIETLLARYGATKFASGWEATRAVIVCETQGHAVRFILPLPDRDDRRFTRDARLAWKSRTKEHADRAYDAECRRLWRALCLVIKAKLESVASGIETFEQAFLANLVVPGTGKTFGEWAIPQIAKAYEDGGRMPTLLGQGVDS